MRQTAMTVFHRLGKRKGDAGSHADERSLLDAKLRSDLIGRAKPDAADIAGQPIGVLRNQPNGISPIGLVDTNRARCADAIAVQKQHDLANHLLLRPARDDPLRALGADTGDFTQTGWLLLNDVEYGFAESAHQLFRIDGAN